MCVDVAQWIKSCKQALAWLPDYLPAVWAVACLPALWAVASLDVCVAGWLVTHAAGWKDLGPD